MVPQSVPNMLIVVGPSQRPPRGQNLWYTPCTYHSSNTSVRHWQDWVLFWSPTVASIPPPLCPAKEGYIHAGSRYFVDRGLSSLDSLAVNVIPRVQPRAIDITVAKSPLFLCSTQSIKRKSLPVSGSKVASGSSKNAPDRGNKHGEP